MRHDIMRKRSNNSQSSWDSLKSVTIHCIRRLDAPTHRRTDAPTQPANHTTCFCFGCCVQTAHSEHTFLQAHINIAERISQVTKSNIFERHIDMEQQFVDAQEPRTADDYLEACISKQEPILKVLRLACLLSLTKGIEKKRYDFLKREIIQTYGYEKMFTLNNLEILGMFRPASKKSVWPTIRKTLKLLEEKEKIDLKQPNDINFTYSGYAPLSVRLVELAARPVCVRGCRLPASRWLIPVCGGVVWWWWWWWAVGGGDDMCRVGSEWRKF